MEQKRKGYLDKTYIGRFYSKELKQWIVMYGDLVHDHYPTKKEANDAVRCLHDDDKRIRDIYRLLYVHLSMHGFIRFYIDIKSKHKDSAQIMQMICEDYLN
jgi:hypothetical protein